MIRRAMTGLIFGKELRDLVRDRRTLALVLLMPAILYPLFGATGFFIAKAFESQPTIVGVLGIAELKKGEEFPPLLDGEQATKGLDEQEELGRLIFRPVEGEPDTILKEKRADAVLTLPEGLFDKIRKAETPVVKLQLREGDDKSKLAGARATGVLRGWHTKLRDKRFEKAGLPKDFDKVIKVEDSNQQKPKEKKAADELRDMFVKSFPLILLMWILTGVIQPAIDLTAGERERGTMETLLISPAERSEIVIGKFLATTTFAFGTVAWNVLWMAGAGVVGEWFLGYPILNYPGLLGCMLLGLPIAMFLAAVCIALGVFAKSTKEGQYYLLPLIFFALPPAFWTLVPGIELSAGNCWVPIAGPMLLQQRLLSVAPDPIPWNLFPPAIVASILWASLALLVAAWQFRRENVLFREGNTEKKSFFGSLFGEAPKFEDAE